MLYFAAVLLFFALFAGILFSQMFARHTIDVSARDLHAHAASIAETFSHFIANYHQGSCNGGGFKSYTRFVSGIAMSDLYLLDENGENFTLGEAEPPSTPLPEEAYPIFRRVFETKEIVVEHVSPSVFDSGGLIAGAPVTDASGNILFALVLCFPVDVVEHAARDSIYILSACLGIALILSIAVSHLLSSHFVMPLYRMTQTTSKLISGDYSVKTGIKQNDEIGMLSAHIDELSIKLEEARKERVQLEQMRQDFFSDISHELRTPIAVLKGNVELLLGNMIREPEQRMEAYEQLLADTNHIHHLVNDLLELTRLRNPHFAIHMEVINLTDVLSDTVRSMRRAVEEKSIAVRFDSGIGVFPVLGDYARLRQLFIILMDNAIKFSPEQSEVLISALPDEERCAVSVIDYGVGFDQSVLEHIFDRYFHNRSKINCGGSGLGLPIAKEIALRHGLELTCESEIGKGSCFTLIFSRHPME